jgi:hypothetical protein
VCWLFCLLLVECSSVCFQSRLDSRQRKFDAGDMIMNRKLTISVFSLFNLYIFTSDIFLFNSESAAEVRLQLVRTLYINMNTE